MHGDFLAEQAASGGELIGGLPFLEWPLAHQNVGRKIEDRLTYGS